MTRIVLVLPLILALGACDHAGSGNGADMVTPQVNETEAAPLNTAQAEPSGPLLAYRDKYPSDKVEGVAFFDQPVVRQAISRAVGGGDNAVTADKLLALDGPETPIEYADGELTAWRCEQHNCGPHNWSLAISPDGKDARVCYHDDEANPPNRWFADGKALSRTDDCQSEG